MRRCLPIFLVGVATAAHTLAQEYTKQTPLGPKSSLEDGPSSRYTFARPIRKVAVIGAGVGGLVSYRELSETGFDVHLFERDTVPGGNWHYTDAVTVNTSIPSNPNVATGDFTPSLPPKGVAYPYVEVYHGVEQNDVRRRAHRAPKPVWESLTTNTPAPSHQIREFLWLAGTPWSLHNRRLGAYLRAFASFYGLNSNDNNQDKIHYNTRLELAEKQPNGQWELTLKTLESSVDGTVLKATWRKEHFDALVVASGRYNSPHVPPIPGLKTWVERFPGRIMHARDYRRPEFVQGENVLIVGAAPSGAEISRDVIKHVKQVYVSIRPHQSPVPEYVNSARNRIPNNATIIGEIRRFLPLPHTTDIKKAQVELTNGTIITGLDRIMFATGYRYSYPFLPRHHNATLGTQYTDPLPEGSDAIEPIVTDGTHLRALYLDAFYIPDPTLVFINANVGIQTFLFPEFVALAAAKVWSGTADLPGREELWRRYQKLYTQRQGYGRHFQRISPQARNDLLRFYQGWLNGDAVKYGGRMIDGLSPDLEQILTVWSDARSVPRNNADISGFSQSHAFHNW